jgi:hypothetical protein
LPSLNKAVKEKTRDHNQTRMQQKPYCREERFLADEKHLLRPLPDAPFELKYYRELKVAKNNHIYLTQDKHYYSVPYAYIGMVTKVVYTRSMVHIYAKSQQIALHIRNYSLGGYTTVKEHLCSAHRHYMDRSPEYYLNKSKLKSQILYQLLEHLFAQNRHPEQLYRTCDGLLNLQRKTDPKIFDKACLIAINQQNYTYTVVLNIIKNKMTEEPETKQSKPLPRHANERGGAYYAQLTISF